MSLTTAQRASSQARAAARKLRITNLARDRSPWTGISGLVGATFLGIGIYNMLEGIETERAGGKGGEEVNLWRNRKSPSLP